MTISLRTMELVTAPDKRALTTEDAKDHLRVTLDDDDRLIDSYVEAATELVENFTRRKLISQTWKMHIRDGFDMDDENRLIIPFAPLSSVVDVVYLDSAGDSQTWATTEYDVVRPIGPQAMAGWIELAHLKSLPSVRGAWNSVTVQFVAGYGDNRGDVPEAINSAIRLITGTMYGNREDVVVGTVAQKIPDAVERLMMPYRAEL